MFNKEMTMYSLESFKAGQRVQLHPATDRWMMGDRYGEVLNVRQSRVIVLTDRGRIMRLDPRDIGEIL
jgi:hypothetical protein